MSYNFKSRALCAIMAMAIEAGNDTIADIALDALEGFDVDVQYEGYANRGKERWKEIHNEHDD